MKSKIIILTATALAVACSAWLGVMAQPSKPSPKWMNDAVYYSTNSWVMDEERNKTNPQPLARVNGCRRKVKSSTVPPSLLPRPTTS